jgi:glycine dehydrogenase
MKQAGVMAEPVGNKPTSTAQAKRSSGSDRIGEKGAEPLADAFAPRHIGPDERDERAMLDLLGCRSLEELIDQTIPASIRLTNPLKIETARGEAAALRELREIAKQNEVHRSFIGMGYYGTITPPVIQRNILENPGWYTQYTPYQAEIAQGRLEALLNFQTMVADLTGLPVANASLLDEATAAAEAMAMCWSVAGGRDGSRHRFFVDANCHPQTIAVVKTRAKSVGIEITIGDHREKPDGAGDLCGILVQYPGTDGRIDDFSEMCARAHAQNILVVAATDLLALTLIKPPGEWGADIAVGSSQRFGVPMGFGGPHAAFMATREEFVRRMPGRLIGISKDAQGNPALRMAIQTREQHIRRERATSNICTAQVLLAVMASMYAVYHGPEGLKRMARRVHGFTQALTSALRDLHHEILNELFFDTLRVKLHHTTSVRNVLDRAAERHVNVRAFEDETLGISLDETTTHEDLIRLIECFAPNKFPTIEWNVVLKEYAEGSEMPRAFARTTPFLQHAVFNTHHSETEMLRYIRKLEKRDLSLGESMIPLGSCTMKLNATSEMLPVTWAEFAHVHPYAPAEQTRGYQALFEQLEKWLAEITGFDAVSLQPNAGSQGEYAGLLAIRAYHEAQQHGSGTDSQSVRRDVCLIPTSAHGTNPASAVIAGLRVVAVECDERGNIDVEDLKLKAREHADSLAAIMITYPSTHGVFEESIREICDIVHQHGGLVYMDGANMNAQVGLTRPADMGADVCHLNLHKTFCIPHGGGGPGMGPIACTKALAPYLPSNPLSLKGEGWGVGESNGTNELSTHPLTPSLGERGNGVGPVSAANWGSASILPISWMHIRMMGEAGLKRATEVAILNANYMAKRLEGHYPVLYRGTHGRCAHEFIVDCRAFEKSAGIKVDDIAKRLMDYGFHAPTMSFPVPGTLMIEPTESESKAELDRFCDALIAIREEIREIERGEADRADNVLKGAPHTIHALARDDWNHPYSRDKAAFPLPWLRDHKFWPHVGRIDNPYGDRNLICTCPMVGELGE